MPLQLQRILYLGDEFYKSSHVPLYPLTAKYGEISKLDALRQHCHIYGYPKKIVLDNGKEFCNKNLST